MQGTFLYSMAKWLSILILKPHSEKPEPGARPEGPHSKPFCILYNLFHLRKVGVKYYHRYECSCKIPHNNTKARRPDSLILLNIRGNSTGAKSVSERKIWLWVSSTEVEHHLLNCPSLQLHGRDQACQRYSPWAGYDPWNHVIQPSVLPLVLSWPTCCQSRPTHKAWDVHCMWCPLWLIWDLCYMQCPGTHTACASTPASLRSSLLAVPHLSSLELCHVWCGSWTSWGRRCHMKFLSWDLHQM